VPLGELHELHEPRVRRVREDGDAEAEHQAGEDSPRAVRARSPRQTPFPGNALARWEPRSWKAKPDPATRSLGREQFFNAERVRACGAGEVVPAEAGESEIREAVEKLLAGESYCAATADMARVVAGHGDGWRAVELVEGLRAPEATAPSDPGAA
jgi:hypothetical protein